MNAVVAQQVALAYHDREVLAEVTFEVPAGTAVAVIGPNGSGKSTLLRAIAGLLLPRRGRLEVAGGEGPGGVAFVLQTTEVDRTLPLTVREAVNVARYGHVGWFGRLGPADREAVDAALRRMEVDDLQRRQLSELSGGQRQRVLVAQGLAQEADVLLLDEPFTGLDVVSRELIGAAIDDERRAGRTVFVTTHELDDARRADLVLLLAGRVVAFGPPDQALAAARLVEAYGSRVLPLADGGVFVDDPHHDHAAHHGHHAEDGLGSPTGGRTHRPLP